jgi:hypothetical protein
LVCAATREQARNRVEDYWQLFDELHFDLNIVIASIEVFRVVDDMITEVWNCGYKVGAWQ